MNKAIFLDRDGVINKEIGGWVYRVEDFKINDDIAEALKLFRKSGFLIIVVTNQSGIAKGVYGHSDVDSVHDFLKRYLNENQVEIDEIFYCPHHDETGRCLCRKPDSLMLEKAIARYDIDVEKSFLIGDKQRDIDAAEKAGVKGILIQPDESILEIARKISKGLIRFPELSE